MSEFIQQRNGYIGEERSKALIPKEFWVLTRSVDAEAADLMVQNEYVTAADARADRGRPLQVASIQAKFFQGTNQVTISNEYLRNKNGSVRTGFLVFLHTDDENEKHVHYLFSADEIISDWNQTKDRQGYYFSLKAGRNYDEYRNIETKGIRDKLRMAITESSTESVSWAWAKASDRYSSVRDPDCLEPRYKIMKIDRAPVAIFKGGYGQLAHALEPRKDVYLHSGNFEWGYGGGGAWLLAASILTHFLCGARPSSGEIKSLVENLLSLVDRDEDAEFGKEEIFKALANIPFDRDLKFMAPPQYNQVLRDYSGYFRDRSTFSRPEMTAQPPEPIMGECEEEEAAPRP
jgi:hypothetical protein